MKVFNEKPKNSSNSKGIVLLILIFAVVFIGSSCHRKVGVKSDGQLKSDKSKCKCKKKKGGVYADFFIQKSICNSSIPSMNFKNLES